MYEQGQLHDRTIGQSIQLVYKAEARSKPRNGTRRKNERHRVRRVINQRKCQQEDKGV